MYKKLFLICCIITAVVSIIIYFPHHFYRIANPTPQAPGHAFGYGSLQLITMIMSFIIAFILGMKKTYLKWIYPFISAVYVWAVPPILFNIINSRVTSYYLMYYLAYGFFFMLIPQFISALLGLGLGLLIFRIHNRKRQNKHQE
jgi:hypothetical protein